MCCSPDASPPRRGFWGSSPSNASGLSPDASPNVNVHDGFDYPEAYSPVCSDQEEDNDNGDSNESTRDDECGEIIDVEAVEDEDDDFVSVQYVDTHEEEIPVSIIL